MTRPPLDLGGIQSPEVRRPFEQLQAQSPAPRLIPYATSTRPNAGALGRGAMIYDQTLSKPIWSDGTVWRDAAGTAV